MTGDSFVRWGWVWSHLDDVGARTIEHLELTGIAVGVGFAIALALAMISLRFRRAYAPITWVTGSLYTIPSLALFTLLASYTGLTRLTAEIGLVSYTLLILLRNIVTGVRGVPSEVREAAIAMGYRRLALFFRIELPLALPVVVAGLRIATVTIVGLITVTALIGQGGYGFFILDGLRRDFTTPLVLGCVLSIALALVFDLVLLATERILTPWSRRRPA